MPDMPADVRTVAGRVEIVTNTRPDLIGHVYDRGNNQSLLRDAFARITELERSGA